jgi:leucyl aminopeptidase
MEKFIFTNKFNIKNIDIYIFVICKDFKESIEKIKKLLNIENFPKKILEDCKLTKDFEQKIYNDNYEVILIGISDYHKYNNQKLYEVFSKIGKSLTNENKDKNIMINLISDNKIIIKNEVISLILGYHKYNFYEKEITVNKSKVYFYYPKLKLKDCINNYIYEALIQNEIINLINIPKNILNSETFLSYIKENIPEDIKVSVINESKLKKLGCNLILGINKVSKNKTIMIILEYKNDKEMINKKKNIA